MTGLGAGQSAGRWIARCAAIAKRLPAQLPGWPIYGAAAVSLLILLLMMAAPRQVSLPLAPADMRQEEGRAYIATIPGLGAWRSLLVLRDDSGGAAHSDLMLVEEGKPIGAPHALHADIRAIGGGRYSHWGAALYFSTADGTDPRANGRRYEIRAHVYPSALLTVILLLTGLVGIGLGARRHARLGLLAIRPIVFLLRPFDIRLGRTGAIAAVAAIVAGGLAVMLAMWLSGVSTSTSYAGFLPISDGKDHFGCSLQLLDFGESGPWCHRRPLYPLFLAGLSAIVGRDLTLIHIGQACLVMASMLLLAREVARWLGLAAAITFVYAILLFAWRWVFGQTMTEALGICLGMLGQAVLLRAAQCRSIRAIWLGVLLLSAALSARPGALFLLPLLVLLAGWLERQNWRNGAIAMGGAAIAVVGGLAAHSAAMIVAHGDLGTSFGNFSLTFYGLATGKDWTAANIDLPGIANAETSAGFQQVYTAAFAAIAAHPDVLLSGLWRNLEIYAGGLWNGWLLPSASIGKLALLIFCAGIVGFQALRSRRASVIGVFLLAELSSAAIIARDSEARVFSATQSSAQIIALLLATILSLRWLATRASLAPPERLSPPHQPPIERAAAALALVLAGLMAIGAGASALAPGAISVTAKVCPGALEAQIVDLQGAGQLIVDQSGMKTLLWPRSIARQELVAGAPPGAWYLEGAAKLPFVRLIEGDQLAAGGARLSFLYAPLALAIPSTGKATFCVDAKQTIDVANAPYARIVSIAP